MTLRARGLTVSAMLGGRSVEVLRDLDIDLAPGRVLGLVGESGAGKSMLGRVIGRTLPGGFAVTAGELVVAGQNMAHLSQAALRRQLGDRITFIPQEPMSALNPLMTLEAQFGEHLARLGVPPAQRRERLLQALNEVSLPDPATLLARYPFQLSGGMCQRVLIAMAFVSKPALVIADEPTTALDVSTQATIVQIIRRLQREHDTALLFITHDLRLAARICDDIMVLYAGEVVERGPAARVATTAPRHPYTRALQAANPSIDGLLRRLTSLPDTMPGLAALADLPGCRFAPRCPTRDAACAARTPPLREVGPGHAVRCTERCETVVPSLSPQILPSTVAPDARPILVVEALEKIYPARRDWLGRRAAPFRAVDKIDLSVRPGEFVGVVGESGSGKSTLARLVMGLEPASAGRILIDGCDVTGGGASVRRVRLGALQMVFQDPQSALNPRRPVERLVTQPLEASDPPTRLAARVARARELLAETGLPPELIDRYPAQLSGGQRQRVNIARALCITPRLLIADEIVSGLDVSVQAQILNLLLDLRAKRGIGLVFISHDLAVVRYLCTRVLVMRRGEVVEAGETVSVFGAPRHAYTRALLAAAPPDDPALPWPPAVAAPH